MQNCFCLHGHGHGHGQGKGFSSVTFLTFLSIDFLSLSLSLSNQNISWPFSYFLNLSLYEKSSISCIAGAIWTRDWLHKLSHPFSLLTWKAYLVTIIIIIMVVKIPIWILRSYNFTISSTQMIQIFQKILWLFRISRIVRF